MAANFGRPHVRLQPSERFSKRGALRSNNPARLHEAQRETGQPYRGIYMALNKACPALNE